MCKVLDEIESRGIAKGRAEGRIEGRAEGRIEGKAEGRIEGKAEGIAKGERSNKISTAIVMLKDGLSIDKVVLYSGLSNEEVINLNNEIGKGE